MHTKQRQRSTATTAIAPETTAATVAVAAEAFGIDPVLVTKHIHTFALRL